MENLLTEYSCKIPLAIMLEYLGWEDIILLASCSKACKSGIAEAWNEAMDSPNSIFKFLIDAKIMPIPSLTETRSSNLKYHYFGHTIGEYEKKMISARFEKIASRTCYCKREYELERPLLGIKKTIFKTCQGETFTCISTGVRGFQDSDASWYPFPFFQGIITESDEENIEQYDRLLEYKNSQGIVELRIGTTINHSFLILPPFLWIGLQNTIPFPYIRDIEDLQKVLPFYKHGFACLKPMSKIKRAKVF